MTWHTLLQHEFLDRNLGNVIGAPGELVNSNPAPLVRPSAGVGIAIAPGKWFGVNFEEDVREIIGLDVKIVMHAPASSGSLPLCQVLGAMSLEFAWESPSRSNVIGGELMAFGDLRIKIGTDVFVVRGVGFPHRRSFELRVNWHTSGQCRIETDRQLIAYDPALSPGVSFVTTGIRFGDSDATITPQLRPRHMLHRILVRAIREDDSVAELLRELAADIPGIPDSERCRIEVENHLQSIVGIMRNFMRGFTRQETQQWSRAENGSTGPFSLSAVDAHKVSTTAFLSAMEFLTRGGNDHRDAYLVGIRKFFEILHATTPIEFEQMLQDLANLEGPSQRCMDAAAAWASENKSEVSSLMQLAEETMQIANDLVA